MWDLLTTKELKRLCLNSNVISYLSKNLCSPHRSVQPPKRCAGLRVLFERLLLFPHIFLSLVPSPPLGAPLSSLSRFLVFSEFVNSLNDWFRDRRALREGKSVVISKLSGILCLLYESWMYRFRGSWCEYADIVVWDSTSAVIQYTARVHQRLRHHVLYDWI